MGKASLSMKMATISKEIILKMRKEEKENIILARVALSSLNLIRILPKYLK